MFWMVPVLFAFCSALLIYVLLSSLREAEETYVSEYAADTARQFEDLFLFIPPEKILRLSHIAAALIFVSLFASTGNLLELKGVIRGGFVGGLGALLVYLLPRLVLSIMRRRRLERFNSQLSQALNGMSNSLKAGFSIQQAFETIADEQQNPISQEFAMLLQQLRIGMSFEEAMADMDRRVGSEDLTLMIQSIEIARQTGGNLTEVFDRIDETIRERLRVQGKIKSLTAQGRIQGRVVGAMPVVLGCILYLLDPPMMMTFLQSTLGMVILGLVLVLEIIGALIIRRIVNIDV